MQNNEERHNAIYIASGNAHKIDEIRNVLPVGTEILNDTIGTEHTTNRDILNINPEETGASFVENALIKARAYYAILCSLLPKQSFSVLADDSGICVDALGGRPGLYSARYGFDKIAEHTVSTTEHNTTLDPNMPLYQCKLLLSEMKGQSNRSARFICCAVLLYSEHNFTISQASWEGSIIEEQARGTSGFGYDPIFFVPETACTAAELSSQQKNTLSHRAKAINRLFS